MVPVMVDDERAKTLLQHQYEEEDTAIQSDPAAFVNERPWAPADIADPDADFVLYGKDERYEARRRLGEGGMGEVLLSRDRVIGREVAMKVVQSEHPRKKELRERFVREARVQGQLEHPAIVPVYDFGVNAEGRAFFTMRRVRGVTLEDILDRLRNGDTVAERAHTRHTLLATFVRVCLAIEFAHEHGVIHRDLKPANVMLGRHGEVYVLDWGLAKVRSASKSLDEPRPPTESDGIPPSDRESLSNVAEGSTAYGAILGTPQYMAPEQILGESLDGRSDVYALGAILFEILTLEPLQGTGSVAAIFKRATQGVDARASVRAPRRDVPPELEAACVRATARKREDRYARARNLANAVEAYLSGDRDVEKRKELAKAHLDRAREAAFGSSLADRSRALSEIGQAVALLPDDPEALEVFVRLLREPPKQRIAEVEARVHQAGLASQRKMLPRAAIAYGVLPLVFMPLLMVLGRSDTRLLILPFVLWLLAAAFALLAWRFANPRRETFPSVTITAGLALAATSLLHGPLLLVPAIGAIMAMGMVLQTPKHNRALLIGINALAIAMPTVLAVLDLHPVRHAFPDGALHVFGGALKFSRVEIAILGTMHVAFVIVGGVFVGAYRDELRKLQRRTQLQSWQLEQLVPPAAADAARKGAEMAKTGRDSLGPPG
jgi:eukaryotic-like serine/threonine-protein kinase